MLYRFKMGALEEIFLQFSNFMFNVFLFQIYKKIPQSPLIVYCNEKNIFRNIGLIKRNPTNCVPDFFYILPTHPLFFT